MAQTVPFDAYLGVSKTGQAIGATIYQLDGTTVYSAFSVTGWYEAPAGSGAFHHAGLSLPDAGGVVAVGVSGTEYQRLAIGADMAAAVWAVLTSTLTGVGTIGKYIVDNLTAASGVWSHTASEPSSVPASNATMSDKLGWLFVLARNKITQTATQQTVRNDADTASIATSAQSADNTTYTRQKWV